MNIARDFPTTAGAYRRKFGTERQCRQYLLRDRWPDGFVCSNCLHKKAWKLANREVWICAKCQHHWSLRAGTLFDKSPYPLTKWFEAIFEVLRSKGSVSALELKRVLGFGSIQTAWVWRHKIVECLGAASAMDSLGPVVQMDDWDIGARLSRKKASTSKNKVKVVGATSLQTGVTRMQVIEDASANSIQAFMHDVLDTDVVLYTDNKASYDLCSRVAVHNIRTVSKEGRSLEAKSGLKVCDFQLGQMNMAISLFKTRLRGTFHNGVQKRHMQAYLNEFCFQYSRRYRGDPLLAVPDLLKAASRMRPRTYRQIVDSAKEKPGLPYKRLKGGREKASSAQWWVSVARKVGLIE